MSKPLILVFAGPNGSGKSTIARHVLHYGVYINADDLKDKYELTDLDAAQHAEAIRNKCVESELISHLRLFYLLSGICFCYSFSYF